MTSIEETHEEEVTWIFRPYYRHPKTGELIWAKRYGRKAWRIPIRKKVEP